MSLGFALVHPARIDTALEANPMRMGFDDGVDTLMASLSIGNPVELAAEYGRELESLVRELGQELSRLFASDGPMGAVIADIMKLVSGELGLAGVLEKICGLVESLDRDRIRIRLTGFIDRVLEMVPLLGSGALVDRLRRIAMLAIEYYQRPFQSGRDDLPAHRGFRAGVFLRCMIEPLLEALDRLRGRLQLGEVLRRMVAEATASLDDKLFAGLAVLKELCTAHIHPIAVDIEALASARISVDVRTMADPATIDQDEFPAPHPPDDGPYWTFDLTGSILGLFWHFWDYQRTWPPGSRWMEHVSTWLIAIWEVFRLCVRAAQPQWLQKSYRNDDTYWFSEWGDFWIQLFLRWLGTVHDMKDWSNWTMSMGIRLAKYFMLWVQCRVPYMFSRSVWYLDKWKNTPQAERPPVPLERYIWGGWPLPWVIAMLLGLLQFWDDFQLQNPFGGIWMGISLVVSILCGGILPHAFNSAFMGEWAGGAAMQRRSGESWALWAFATLAVMWIVMMAFGATNPGQEGIGSEWGAELIYTLVCLVLFVLAVLPAAQDGESAEASEDWKRFILIVHVSIGGALVAGAAPFFLWWIVRDDGRDANDKFSNRGNLNDSPWNLPYPSGESWFCGQGFHGIFSHTAKSALPGDADNHYAYDFNEAYGEKAVASRDGYVFALQETRDDGKYRANFVEAVNLDWVEHFDPGTNEERIVGRTTYFHLAKEKTRLVPGQVFRRGQFVAQIDDTGVSALNHLHFQGFTRDSASNDHTFPVRFKDGSLRRFRSWGHHDGRGFSFRYYRSQNQEQDPLWHMVTIDTESAERKDHEGNAISGSGHTHKLEIDASILTNAGAIPDTFTVYTDVVDGHRHQVQLSKDQLKVALQRGTPSTPIDTQTTVGHTHALHFPAKLDRIARSSPAMTLGQPPTAQLVGRTELPVDLRGEHMVLRVDDNATAFFEFGSDHGTILADVALDRAPAGAVQFTGKAARTPTTVFVDDAAGQLGAAAGPEHVVRLEPMLVIETRRRGTGATLEVSRADLAKLGIELPTGVASLRSQGSGFAADLSAVPRAAIVDHIRDVLQTLPAPPIPAITTSLAPNLTFALAASPVTSFANSSPRIEQVLSPAYAAGSIRRRGSLPLSDGRVVLTAAPHTATGFLLATPARIVVSRAPAWLDSASVTDKFLVVELNGNPKHITFDVIEITPDLIARRIMREVSGVRAWADGDDVVVETVAAGRDVTLKLSKDKPASAPAAAANFASPVVRGSSAPLHGGGAGFADSTSITPAELQAVLDDIPRFTTGPIVGVNSAVAMNGDLLRINLTAGTMTHAFGGSVGDVLHLPAPAAAAATLESTAAVAEPIDFRFGGWLDLDFGGANKRRIAFDGAPARLEIGPIRKWPADHDTFTVTINGTAVQITEALGLRSLESLAHEILLATSAVTVRIAYRYGFDNAGWGNDALSLVDTDGLLGAGLLRALPRVIHPNGRGSDVQNLTSAGTLGETELMAGSLAADPAPFVAAIDGTQVKVSAPAGREVKIDSIDTDPFRLVGATPGVFSADVSTNAVDIPLGAGVLRYRVETRNAAGATPAEPIRSRFEIAAAPATLTSKREPEVRALAHDLELTARVTKPHEAAAGQDVFEYHMNFRGVTNLDEVVARLTYEVPLVAVWLKDRTRLHIETVGAGSGWSLHLEGTALPHLGFDSETAGLTASGKGDVRNAAFVTAAEIVAVVNDAAKYATRTDHQILDVRSAGATVVVSSFDGPVALETRPASLRTHLGASDVGETIVFDPGAAGSFAVVDNGVLEFRVGGRVVTTAFIHGTVGTIEGTTDPSAHLPAVAGTVTITVNGTPHPVPMAGLTTLDAIMKALQTAAREAWFGVVPDTGGNPVLRVESRRRGTGANVTLTVPAAGDLGFAAVTTGPSAGTGVVANLDTMTPNQLLTLLTAARGDNLAPQTLVSAQPVDVGGIDGISVALVGVTDGARINAPAPGVPSGLTFNAAAGGRIEATMPAPVDVVPGVLAFTVQTGPVIHRRVQVPFWANPGRISGLRLPAALADLDGKVLSFTVGTDPIDITFAAITSPADVVLQIHKACAYKLKARVVAGVLDVETRRVGTGARVELRAARFGSDALAVIDNPPVPHLAEGNGVAANLNEMTAVEYARAIVAGYAGPRTTRLRTSVVTHARTYKRGATVPKIRYQSDQLGCHSAVIPVRRAPGLELDRSLQRGPTVRASVKLEPTTNSVALDGVLPIVVSRPGSPTETRRVEVGFAAGNYTPERIAATIDAALAGEGLGRAAAYHDNAVVVETATPGLLGTIEVDRAGTSATVRTALPAAGTGKARGWPGAAMDPRSGEPSVHGYRSRINIADKRDGIVWTFGDGVYNTDPFTLAAGHATMENLQQAVDGLLGQAKRNPADSPKRIGHARLGDDGALYIEGMPGSILTLEVKENGTVTTVREPSDVWLYHEPASDPGMDLRPTHVIRTWRRVFDPVGQLTQNQLKDLGWIRVQVDTTAVPTNEQDVRDGHYFVSARPEAGRAGTDTYGDATDLVISGGKAAIDGQDVVFLHQVRYGVAVSGKEILGVIRMSEPVPPATAVAGAQYVFHVFVD